MDQQDKILLGVAIFSVVGVALTLAYAYFYNRATPVVQFENSNVTHYRTKTGVYLHCLQGGKSKSRAIDLSDAELIAQGWEN